MSTIKIYLILDNLNILVIICNFVHLSLTWYFLRVTFVITVCNVFLTGVCYSVHSRFVSIPPCTGAYPSWHTPLHRQTYTACPYSHHPFPWHKHTPPGQKQPTWPYNPPWRGCLSEYSFLFYRDECL